MKVQSFNNLTDSWVKMQIEKGKPTRILDQKQRNPLTPFANVPVYKKRKK